MGEGRKKSQPRCMNRKRRTEFYSRLPLPFSYIHVSFSCNDLFTLLVLPVCSLSLKIAFGWVSHLSVLSHFQDMLPCVCETDVPKGNEREERNIEKIEISRIKYEIYSLFSHVFSILSFDQNKYFFKYMNYFFFNLSILFVSQ